MTDEELIGQNMVLDNGLILFKPEIICHPNVPRPLHGVAPRVIKGTGWWNKIRKKVYLKYDFHCGACGVHQSRAKRFQRLEAHEFYEVDHYHGIVRVKSLEPLCNYCHSFIHTGRMINTLSTKQGMGRKTAIAVLNHGFRLCVENDLKCYIGAIEAAEVLRVELPDGLKWYEPVENENLKWSDWKMIFDGEEHPARFQSQEEWANHYELEDYEE